MKHCNAIHNANYLDYIQPTDFVSRGSPTKIPVGALTANMWLKCYIASRIAEGGACLIVALQFVEPRTHSDRLAVVQPLSSLTWVSLIDGGETSTQPTSIWAVYLQSYADTPMQKCGCSQRHRLWHQGYSVVPTKKNKPAPRTSSPLYGVAPLCRRSPTSSEAPPQTCRP